jgi:hypothetical protein
MASLILAATTSRPSPLTIMGGGALLLGALFALAAPIRFYAETERSKTLERIGRFASVFGALGVLIGVGLELTGHGNPWIFGTLIVVVLGILGILFAPLVLSGPASSEPASVPQSPDAITGGKGITARKLESHNSQVSQHENGAENGEVAIPLTETGEGP